jgi:aryl-alcohol dehydrogenase-like predicted oxidoreductase
LANGVRNVETLAEKDLRRNMPRFNEDNWPKNLRLVDAFNAIAAEEGVTPAQLSLAWVLSRGKHVVAIPGTASIAHLDENIARWDWELSAETADRLEAIINQETVAGPRYGAVIQKTIDTEEFA